MASNLIAMASNLLALKLLVADLYNCFEFIEFQVLGLFWSLYAGIWAENQTWSTRSNKCLASSNKCLAGSNKKLLELKLVASCYY